MQFRDVDLLPLTVGKKKKQHKKITKNKSKQPVLLKLYIYMLYLKKKL